MSLTIDLVRFRRFHLYSFIFIFILNSSYNFKSVSSEEITTNDKCPDVDQAPRIEIDCGENCKELFLAGNGTVLSDTPLKLRCTASYPVYWDFDPPHGLYKVDLKSRTLQDSISIPISSTSICYEEVLTLSGKNSFSPTGRSGNYTCRGLLNADLASWKYLYIRDSYGKLFQTIGTDQIVYSELVHGKEWSIPCKAHLEYLENVTLINEDTLQNWTTLTMDPNSTIRYDTKYGFLLQKSAHSRPDGKFTCKASFGNTTTDIIKMKISSYNAIPSTNFVQYLNNYTFSLTCDYDETIHLDLSEAENLTVLKSFNQTSPSFNYSVTYIIQANPNNYTAGIIKCVTDNNFKIVHQWNHNLDKFCNCTYENSSPTLLAGIKNRQNAMTPTFTCSPLENATSSLIPRSSYQSIYLQYLYGEDRTKYNFLLKNYLMLYKTEVNDYRQSYYGRRTSTARTFQLAYSSVVAGCTIGDYTTIIAPRASLEGFIDDETPDSQELEKIQVGLTFTSDTNATYEYFTGDPINFTCIVSRYDSIGPFKWSFQYRNGSTMYTTKSFNQSQFELNWGYGRTIKLPVTDDLHSVSCSALLWGSTTEWITANSTIDALIKVYNYKVWNSSDYGRCDSSSDKPMILMKRSLRSPWSVSTAIRKRFDGLEQHYVTDSDLLFDNTVYKLMLNCTAKYPIQWFFQNEPFINSTTVTYTSSKITNSGRVNRIFTGSNQNQNGNNKSPCFLSTINVDANFIASTGEFSCRKRSDSSLKSSVYLYTSYKEPAYLIQAGQHLDVTVDENEAMTNIPCRITHPSHSINIYKHKGNKDPLKKLSEKEDYEHYNPKTGFVFHTSKLDLSSVYICTAGNETDPTKTISISLIKSTKLKATDINDQIDRATSEYVSKQESYRFGFISLQFINLLLIACTLTVLVWFVRRQKSFTAKSARPIKYYSYNQLTENGDY